MSLRPCRQTQKTFTTRLTVQCRLQKNVAFLFRVTSPARRLQSNRGVYGNVYACARYRRFGYVDGVYRWLQ